MQESQLLNEQECKDTVHRLHELKLFWLDRGWGYTLGAAAYIDDPKLYPPLANAMNNIMAGAFGELYKRLAKELTKQLDLKNDVVSQESVGIPGFHIFDHNTKDVTGSIHIDQPYKRIDWGYEHTGHISFTLALELPACGAGLDVWEGYVGDDSDLLAGEEVPDPTTHDYELGKLYIHDGNTAHRMRTNEQIKEGEHRITLQGHGLINPQGQLVIYF